MSGTLGRVELDARFTLITKRSEWDRHRYQFTPHPEPTERKGCGWIAPVRRPVAKRASATKLVDLRPEALALELTDQIAALFGPPAEQPSHHFRLLRPADLVVLDVLCFGLQVQVDADGVALVPTGASARLEVRYTFQHLLESAEPEMASPPPPTPVPIPARAARGSRLVYEVPTDERIPYSVEGVLSAISRLKLIVVPLALPRPAPPRLTNAVLGDLVACRLTTRWSAVDAQRRRPGARTTGPSDIAVEVESRRCVPDRRGSLAARGADAAQFRTGGQPERTRSGERPARCRRADPAAADVPTDSPTTTRPASRRDGDRGAVPIDHLTERTRRIHPRDPTAPCRSRPRPDRRSGTRRAVAQSTRRASRRRREGDRRRDERSAEGDPGHLDPRSRPAVAGRDPVPGVAHRRRPRGAGPPELRPAAGHTSAGLGRQVVPHRARFLAGAARPMGPGAIRPAPANADRGVGPRGDRRPRPVRARRQALLPVPVRQPVFADHDHRAKDERAPQPTITAVSAQVPGHHRAGAHLRQQRHAVHAGAAAALDHAQPRLRTAADHTTDHRRHDCPVRREAVLADGQLREVPLRARLPRPRRPPRRRSGAVAGGRHQHG